jgi:hypothetical protein
MMGEATTSKITELGLYTTMLLAMDTARKINLSEQAFSSK